MTLNHLIDSHCHIVFSTFQDDLDEVAARWRAAGACALQRGNFETYAASVGLNAGAEQAEEQLIGQVPFVRYLTDRATLLSDGAA